MSSAATPQHKPLKAFEALEAAHRLAISPFVFQLACSLESLGVVGLCNQKPQGVTYEEVVNATQLSTYSVDLLLQAGQYFQLLDCAHERWSLSKVGEFTFNDPLVKRNFDFTRDVCYQGLEALAESFKTGKPAGLKHFGDWETIYPALTSLPEKAQQSWFAFDHFYSDQVYQSALPIVFANKPRHVAELGGNTGRWAQSCCQFDAKVRLSIFDLPEQCQKMTQCWQTEDEANRITLYPCNLLDETELPKLDADCWWMSQFLDCFAPHQVVSILKKVRAAMRDDAKVFILEPFIGQQPFAIGDECLVAYSLYFTAMANGQSRFYHLHDMEMFIEAAGLKIVKNHYPLGIGYTLLECQKA